MSHPSKYLLALAAFALLAACEKQSTLPVATEPDIVTVKLAQAADKASQALDSIAGIEQMRSPVPPAENYDNAPQNLMQPISVRWSGPIEQITQALAERAGLRFRVKGSTPPVPITVNVDAYQQPLLHVLRDVGLQAGQRANIAVDGPGGAIELRYAPNQAHANIPAAEVPAGSGYGTLGGYPANGANGGVAATSSTSTTTTTTSYSEMPHVRDETK